MHEQHSTSSRTKRASSAAKISYLVLTPISLSGLLHAIIRFQGAGYNSAHLLSYALRLSRPV